MINYLKHANSRPRLQSTMLAIGIVLGFLTQGCSNERAGNNQSPKRPQLVVAEKEFRQPWFQDATTEYNLNFVNDPGDPSDYFMPRDMGSGIAIFDYNRDGLMDVLLLQGAGPDSDSRNQLFTQTEDHQFKDVSENSGLSYAAFCTGVATGDVNNDGWPDVLITEYQQARLFLNQSGDHFEEITQLAGIDNPLWGASCCFTDYNRDGLLDIVIANYVDYSPSRDCWGDDGKQEFCGPNGFAQTTTKLFENIGSDGLSPRFKDVTLESGLARHPGSGLGIVCLDFTGDHWPDIFVADDASPNRLFVNQKNGKFKEEAGIRGIALNAMGQTQANMGIGFGDVDGDEAFDIFVTHLSSENHTLWQQGPIGFFSDTTIPKKIRETRWKGTAFGTALADFNHDGWEDIIFVNGSIRSETSNLPQPTEELPPFWHPYAQRSQILQNQAGDSFTDISSLEEALSGEGRVGRGLATADIDNDGDLDVITANTASSARLLKGSGSEQGEWLIVRAILPSNGGRNAIGAEVTVRSKISNIKRWLCPSFSYLCSNDPRLHFGLGKITEYTAIDITWPDGTQERFPAGKSREFLTLAKGSGSPIALPTSKD